MGQKLDIERLIGEKWCLYEGELLIQLRERLDGRLLLGKVLRVLHNWECGTEKIDLGVTREDKKILDLQEAS